MNTKEIEVVGVEYIHPYLVDGMNPDPDPAPEDEEIGNNQGSEEEEEEPPGGN